MKIGKILKNLDKNFNSHSFSNIRFNSEKCKKNDIFFAIKGTKQNGNKFIKNAIKNGASTIVSNLKYQGFKNNILFLKSQNPRALLSEVSANIYSGKPKNIVAVTGTNGKSSIANFFYQILNLQKKKVASIGTLGVSYQGSNTKTQNTSLDPISINKLLQNLKNKNCNNVILEASSHGLKQNRLDGIKFNLGIFTNLSRDHIDYHKSFDDYFKSKLILFNKLMKTNAKIIYDKDIIYSNSLKKISKNKKLKSITLGSHNSDVKINIHRYFKGGQEIGFKYKNRKYIFKTKLIGKIQIKNLIMAILAAHNSNISLKKIIKSIHKIKPVDGRLEQIGNLKDKSLVVLDYAHTPDALKTTLENLKDQFKFSKISIVFGCGGERDKPKRRMMGKIANNLCDKIYLTDDNPRKENPKKIKSEIKKSISKSKLKEIASREKAIYQSIDELNSGDILLVAGKGHENYQEYYKKRFFSDRYFILKRIKYKNKKLSNNWKINIINQNLDKTIINNKSVIKKTSINSRTIKKNDIFFGIKGKKLDGNKFANESIKKGATLAIVDRNFKSNHIRKVKVKNSLKFLSEYSKTIRKVSNISAIAITGSSGKTTLKDLLGSSLNKIISTYYSNRSFNNKFGVPLSLSNIEKKNELGVFEVGMNRKGEINFLSNLILPNIGIITNISYAHIKNFKNLNQIASAKSELIDNIISGGTIVLNRDDKFFNFFKKKALDKKLKIVSFSKKHKADIQLKQTKKHGSKYILYLKVFNKIKKFVIQKKFDIHLPNILATVAVIALYFDIQKINHKIFENFKIPDGRGNEFKIKLKNKKLNIIDESYNSNPLSLNFAIKKFDILKVKSKYKKVLLGDMKELGKYSKKLHSNAAKILNKSSIDKVYVYGKYIKETFNKIKTHKKGKILKNKKEILNLVNNYLYNNDYLMIKGSNSTGLNDMISKIKKGQRNAL